MSLNVTQLKFFADYIQKELGIIYSHENYFQLEKRLNEIAKQISAPTVDDLFTKAQTGIGGHFKQLLLDVATNNETSFFRDPKAFSAVENHIIPGIVATFPNLPVIRIWSAASSFGQEPYSLAMLLLEMAKRGVKMPRFEIIATDVSLAALSRAREGVYSQLEIQRGLSAALMVKYFTKTKDDQWVVKPEVRMCVQFKTQNLLESLANLGTFELVLCRNVLIYQKEDKKREIVDQISKRIAPGGYFLLGAAESLLGVSDAFEQIVKDGAVFFRRKA